MLLKDESLAGVPSISHGCHNTSPLGSHHSMHCLRAACLNELHKRRRQRASLLEGNSEMPLIEHDADLAKLRRSSGCF